MSTDFGDFLSHGGTLPDQPIQPPERPALYVVPRRELTQAEKLKLILRMVKHAQWRNTVLEALPESDSYDLFLNGILFGDDKSTADLARQIIVQYVEDVLAQRLESWSNYE